MGNKDYYDILGVKKDVTDSDLKAAYHRLSMKYHPDRQAGKTDSEKKAAEEKFKEVSEAYSVLSDKDKRARYDQFGSADAQGNGFDFGGVDPMDIFRKMHHGGFGFPGFGFGDDDGDIGGNQQRQAPDFNAPENGNDIAMQTSISFKESVFGCKKEMDLDLDKECPECHGTGIEGGSTPVECPDCHGSGYISRTVRQGWMTSQTISPCPRCHGTGFSVKHCRICNGAKRVHDKRHISVKIPAGLQDGMRVLLKGLGQCGVKGGSNGSIYLTVRVERSDLFERNNNDIYLKVYVSPVIAALGGKMEIPTVYGYKKIKIEPGTANGTRLRIAGAGVKPASGSTGDMIVEVEIESYSNLSAEQKGLLEKLGKLDADSNFPKNTEMKRKASEFYR